MFRFRILSILAIAFASPSTLGFLACSSGETAEDDGNDPDAGFVNTPDPVPSKTKVDGGFQTPQGVIRSDRFVTKVVSFTPGECAGFGSDDMPGIVQGPPVGAGKSKGGTDVVALGKGGEIVLSFEPNAIVDGPGPDFIVFENAFYTNGNPSQPFVELGEVSVSDDGNTWHTFPCSPGASPPYGDCAGWHPVLSAPGNGISPIDPNAAGGEAYDLAKVQLEHAKYVRIRDLSTDACTGSPKPNNLGFDLDAIAIINAQTP